MNPKNLLFLLVFLSASAQAQLTITPKTAAQATSVVLNDFLVSSGPSSGIHSVTNVNFRGGPQGLATFTGTSNLGISPGIILTSGAAPNIDAPAGNQNDEDHSVEGDPDLQTLSVNQIRDVAVLEFDFVPKADTIRFRYSFASEEYPEYVCSVFNDVFGFFITGPKPGGGTYAGQNIATVPGTTIPVGVNSVNPGFPGANSGGGTCNLANQSLAYSAYYVSNNGTTVIFDGFTVVIEAVIPVVQCADYHLKLAVGDASDGVFDSGVFLDAHSFGGGPIHLQNPDPTTSYALDTSIMCPGDTILLVAPASTSYAWNPSGNGNVQSINATVPGNYTCFVFNPANGCANPGFTHHIIGSTAVAQIDTLGLVTLCNGDSVQLFSAFPGSSYQWSNGETTSSIWVDYSEIGSYTLTVTDIYGKCDSTSSPVTIFSGSASATITPQSATTFCAGSSVNLTANPGSSYLWSNGATTQTITVTTTDSLNVTVTSGACAASSLFIHVTMSAPSVAISAGPLSFCQGDSVQLTATAGYPTYTWGIGASGNSIWVSAGGNITVTVTDSVGCNDADSVTIIVNSASANITALTDSVLCQGDSIQLTANAGSIYTWSNGETSQSIWVDAAGTYDVQVENANGCSAQSDAVNIYMSTPVASITSPAGNTTICDGSNISITAIGGGVYNWSNGASSSTINLTPVAGDTYIVTVTDAAGCQASDSVVVDVSFPSATITPSGNTTFCKGDNVTLNANTGTWLWSNGVTTSSITVDVTGTYTVTVTDAFGCSATDDMLITVNEATAVISPAVDSTFCDGQSILLSNNSANVVSTQWSNGASTPSLSVNNSDTWYFIVTDINGCKDTSDFIQTTVSYPSAIITPQGPTTICPNTSVILEANQGDSYLWSDGSTSQSIQASLDGGYTVTVTNNFGCFIASLPVTVIVSQPVATASVTGPTALCPGAQAVITANLGASYLWHPNGETTRDIFVNTAGDYSVDVTDNAGCIATSLQVNITQLPAEALTSTSGATSFCDGGSVTLFATTPGTAFLWSNGETTSSITVNYDDDFNVAITNNNGCIANSDWISVEVHEYPVVSFTADSSSECEAFKIRFHNYSTYDSGSSFSWTFADGGTSSSPSPVHWYTNNGVYNVTLMITTPFGCATTDSNEIEVIRYPDPLAKFTMSSNVENVFTNTIAFRNVSENAIRFHWDFGDNTGSTEVNPVHDYREPGYYTVTLTAFNPANCEDQETNEVTVTPLYIPSAFTPNGDGKNEVFPGGLPENMDVNGYEISIYNRWGQRVFVSDSPNDGWDGKGSDGSLAPAGSYVYQMKVADRLNKEFNFKGTFTLLR